MHFTFATAKAAEVKEMKRTQIQNFVLTQLHRAIAVVATSGLMALVACSSSPNTAVHAASAQSSSSNVAQPVATVQPVATKLTSKAPSSSPVQKTLRRELITFKDDNFGISL